MTDATRDDRAILYGFRRNLVVAASAGTGKTHALVGVLVHLAMGASEELGGSPREPVPLGRIVATTFSRKAAVEIRARLVRELTRLASADPDAPYRADLLRAFGRAGARVDEEELAGRARRALDGVGAARVGTLHGFAASIVRSYGLALGWAPGFAIEAEEDTEARMRDAASRSLEDLLAEDERGAREILRVAGGAEPLILMIPRLLGQLTEDGRNVASLGLPEDDAGQIEAKVALLLEHARDLCRDDALGAPARSLCDAWDSGDADRLEEAASDLTAVAARGRAGERARGFFDFRGDLPGATHRDRGRNLVRLFRARRRVVPVAALFRTLLARTESAHRASMKRDSALSYGEVLAAARDTLSTDGAAARELGRGLDAFLVDEFQDTSRVQREIVELSFQDLEGALSASPGPRIARVRRTGLLVVGDRKQSIYGFRGADVGSFAELCIGLAGKPAREALRIPPGRVWEPEEPVADFVALRENRRSAPEILSFVNAYSGERLVAARDPAELYEIQYAPRIEDLSPAEDTPWATAEAPRVSWIPVPTGGKVASSRVDEAELIARRIGQMLDRGTPHVRGLPPTPKDIAVLAVRNAMLDATAHALARAGIPYVVAGNGFFAAREVLDMLDMLALITDPEDAVARVSVLRGVWCGASDESLIALTEPHAGIGDVRSWDKGTRKDLVRPEDRARIGALRDVVLRLRDASSTIGPAETLRQATRALELEETLILLPRGEQRVANIRKLIALAEPEDDARAFLATVRRASEEERPEPEAATFSEDDDAVRLLTVHGSKGLDFPIVFLPEAGANSRGPERLPVTLRLDGEVATIATRVIDEGGKLHDAPAFAAAQAETGRREIAEWARLAYVAATRAREAVVFVGDRRAPKGAPSDAYRSTTAAALATLSAEPGVLFVEPTPERLVPRASSVAGATVSRAPSPSAPRTFHATLTASELADFALCPRRFQLAQIVGLPEPKPGATGSLFDTSQATGTARDAYAASAAREGARVERDRAFLARAASEDVTATLHGGIDLWIERPGGGTEAVLVATEPGSASPRTDLLAEMAALALGDAEGHVTGVLSAARGVRPVWRVASSATQTAATRRRLLATVTSCVGARWTNTFPRVEVATCRAIDCGYVGLCHPHATRR